SAETAQLLTPPRRVRQVDAVGLGAVLQLADPRAGMAVVHGLVVVPRGQRDRPLDPVAQHGEVYPAQIVPSVSGACRDHPAAGIAASTFRLTVLTADHFPSCASGISARCGWMTGSRASATAWAAAASSTADAHERTFGASSSTMRRVFLVSPGESTHASRP